MAGSSDELMGDSYSSSEIDVASDYDNISAPRRVAPKYTVPSRELTAVEIPAIVENPDRAVRAFGRVASLAHVSVPAARLSLNTHW